MNNTNKNNKENKSIACTVEQCKNHNTNTSFCTLDSIQIGTHEANPSMDQCTDCQSFQCKTPTN